MKSAEIVIKPALQLSERTAMLKAERFIRNAAQEIEARHERMNVVEKRLDAIYRKPLTRFRALCKDPSLAEISVIVKDTPKRLTFYRVFHAHSRDSGHSYFYLVHYIVSNKKTIQSPLNKPVDIYITGHALARMVERGSVEWTLDLSIIRTLLTRLLAAAINAEYDENDTARIGIQEYPGMIFVCCRNRWMRQHEELPAYFSIVTYFEK